MTGLRVVATHLQDNHYATQLIERLAWAAIDAEQLETPTNRERPDKHRGLRPRRDTAPSQPVSSPHPRPVPRHPSRLDMTTKRPIATRPAPTAARGGQRTTRQTRAPSERDHGRADTRWLSAWSYDALRPTGELLAARLTTPAALRPGRVGRVSPRTRRRHTSP